MPKWIDRVIYNMYILLKRTEVDKMAQLGTRWHTMRPAKYAEKVFVEVKGDMKKFMDVLIKEMGKPFHIAERQYYACKANSYNRYA